MVYIIDVAFKNMLFSFECKMFFLKTTFLFDKQLKINHLKFKSGNLELSHIEFEHLTKHSSIIWQNY